MFGKALNRSGITRARGSRRPGESPAVRARRVELMQAVADGEHPRALALVAQLEVLEPTDPRWPHKRGDLLRTRSPREAATAYRRAAQCYDQQGHPSRAAAILTVARALTGISAPVDADPLAHHPMLLSRRPLAAGS
jgi:hypothetical protein